MTYWNYAGRGRGGVGGRWGQGQGGGRVGGMSWVRGGRGTTVVGGNHYRGAISQSSIHSKWVRPKADTNAVKEFCGDDNDGADAHANAQRIKTNPQPATSLLQRGPYKLVTRVTGENRGKPGERDAEAKVPTNFEATNCFTRGDGRLNSDDSQDDADPSYSQNLKRVAKNQLGLKGAVKNSIDPDVESQDPHKARLESSIDKDGPDAATVKDASIATSGIQKIPDRKGESKAHVSSDNGKLPGASKKRPLPSHFPSRRPLAQRIKLPNQGDKDRDSGQDSEATADIRSGIKHEKLSDFAYRETGRLVKQGHQNLTWKAGDSSIQTERQSCVGPRKMSLIRAKQANAPICPFYARGTDCTDQFCRKRHDVPLEAAVPVCSYFQRNGQCFKDECKFRHVKTRSIVCPTFTLLGYCDNSDCTMKHSRPVHKPTAQKGLWDKGNRRSEGHS